MDDTQEIEDVMALHGSRLTPRAWRNPFHEGRNWRAPIFFVTAAASWGSKLHPSVIAQREEQYASNIGNILSLGFRVFATVSPVGNTTTGRFALIDELQAASHGLMRVHYCSQDTAMLRRSGGPDETLCVQEAIRSLFGECIEGRMASWCPSASTHVVRMSGRYLMAKYTVLRAIYNDGDVDGYVKWGGDWIESPERTFKQAYTFMFSMKFQYFIDCHLRHLDIWEGMPDNIITNPYPNNVWHINIEKLTADCFLSLPHFEVLPELGVLANIANSPSFEYFL